MNSLRPPFLGPIVGHTTDRSCRLWIQASDPDDSGADLSDNHRTLGVIAVIAENGAPLPDPPAWYFRLHREFDRTGTFHLGEDRDLDGKPSAFTLKPGTRYTVRMGTYSLIDNFDPDDMVPDEALTGLIPPAASWVDDLKALPEETSEAEFTTFPDESRPQNRLSFLMGSCQYPGLFWKRKRADQIFGPMLDHVRNNPYGSDPRFVLLMGDQIYADMLNRNVPLFLADTYEEFQERYRASFGTSNRRRILKNVPHYMILDDHEIEDNWSQDRIDDSPKRKLFQIAIGAYMSYQWSHSPRSFGKMLFYQFVCGGYPFFVLDTRTQRFRGPTLKHNHLLGRPSSNPETEPSQLDILCKWLLGQQEKRGNVPKFIVSSGVFVPNEVDTLQGEDAKYKSDSWPAFPETRSRIIDHIVKNGIQNVIFLSGDIHNFNVAEIRFGGHENADQLKALSVTSSGLYWPFPFADGDPSGYVHDSHGSTPMDTFQTGSGITMDYVASNFTQDDHFCQIDIDKDNHCLVARPINRDGELIRERTLSDIMGGIFGGSSSGGGKSLEKTVELAPWYVPHQNVLTSAEAGSCACPLPAEEKRWMQGGLPVEPIIFLGISIRDFVQYRLEFFPVGPGSPFFQIAFRLRSAV